MFLLRGTFPRYAGWLTCSWLAFKSILCFPLAGCWFSEELISWEVSLGRPGDILVRLFVSHTCWSILCSAVDKIRCQHEFLQQSLTSKMTLTVSIPAVSSCPLRVGCKLGVHYSSLCVSCEWVRCNGTTVDLETCGVTLCAILCIKVHTNYCRFVTHSEWVDTL